MVRVYSKAEPGRQPAQAAPHELREIAHLELLTESASPIVQHLAGAAWAQALGTVRFKHCAASEYLTLNNYVAVAACAKDKRPSSSSHPGFIWM
eukprot:5231695-Lingulodinium_polyedra.AAC.1